MGNRKLLAWLYWHQLARECEQNTVCFCQAGDRKLTLCLALPKLKPLGREIKACCLLLGWIGWSAFYSACWNFRGGEGQGCVWFFHWCLAGVRWVIFSVVRLPFPSHLGGFFLSVPVGSLESETSPAPFFRYVGGDKKT